MTTRLIALSFVALGIAGCAGGGGTPSATRSAAIWIQNKSEAVLRVTPYEAGIGTGAGVTDSGLRAKQSAPIIVDPGQTVTKELWLSPDAKLSKGEAPAALTITARQVSDSSFKGTWVVTERADGFRVVAVQDQVGSVHLFWGSPNGDELRRE